MRNRLTTKTAKVSLFSVLAFAAAAVLIPIATGSSSGEDDRLDTPAPLGDKVLVTSGSAGALHWALYAYDSARGLCFEQRYSGAATSVSTTCGAVPAGRSTRMIIDTFGPGGGAAGQFVYGPTRSNVAAVDVELANGQSVHARAVAAPAKLGSPVGFYVAAVPSGADVAGLRARDGAGRVLESYRAETQPQVTGPIPSHGSHD